MKKGKRGGKRKKGKRKKEKRKEKKGKRKRGKKTISQRNVCNFVKVRHQMWNHVVQRCCICSDDCNNQYKVRKILPCRMVDASFFDDMDILYPLKVQIGKKRTRKAFV